MANERLLAVHIVLNDLDEIDGLGIDAGCMPIRRRKDGRIELKAMAPERSIAKLKAMEAQGIAVHVHPDDVPAEAAIGRLVSSTNRYAKGETPRGIGKRKP